MNVVLGLWFLLADGYTPAVDRLGNPSYPAREAATRKVEAAGPLSLPAVCRGLRHQDPEIRARCRQVWDHAAWKDVAAHYAVCGYAILREADLTEWEVDRLDELGQDDLRFRDAANACLRLAGWDYYVSRAGWALNSARNSIHRNRMPYEDEEP
jgi:hypothetical protein